MITIRRLGDNDEAEWMRLRLLLWPDDTVAETQAEMDVIRADPEQPVWVAERPDGGLCGLLEVAIHTSAPGCETDRIGYLEGWYVDADYRQTGVGRRLVEAAEAWARSMGCTEMASDTSGERPISPAAHAALGYDITEIYFRKPLD